jgi:hypothetical protein
MLTTRIPRVKKVTRALSDRQLKRLEFMAAVQAKHIRYFGFRDRKSPASGAHSRVRTVRSLPTIKTLVLLATRIPRFR